MYVYFFLHLRIYIQHLLHTTDTIPPGSQAVTQSVPPGNIDYPAHPARSQLASRPGRDERPRSSCVPGKRYRVSTTG